MWKLYIYIKIGRLVRDLFPIPRGNRPNLYPSSNSLNNSSHLSNRNSKDNSNHRRHTNNGAFRSQNLSGELTVVADTVGRYGVSMTSPFIGNDSLQSLNKDQKHDLGQFEEFSEFAIKPEK